jgi:hypothetical protein
MLRTLFHISSVFFAFSLSFFGFLHAQLDPKLQVGKTDFLNLYQQTATVKSKPEIVSILDFSGSMDTLMNHPLYNHLNSTDENEAYTRNVRISIPINTSEPISNVTGDTFIVSLLTRNTNTDLMLTFRNLVKPDGTIVTAQDAEKCQGLKTKNGSILISASQSGMYTGTSSSGRDVGHWIMAASHVRYECTATGNNPYVTGALGRVIDIPLPWKIMDYTSTGNPLSSKTIKDEQTKISIGPDGNRVTTRYGSGLNMEFDLNYKVNHDNAYSKSGGSSIYTLPTNTYRTSYLHWLFNGRYQSTVTAPNVSSNDYITGTDATSNNGAYYTNDPSLVGKFIVFGAGNDPTKWAAGQTDAKWGQGYWGHVYTNSAGNKTSNLGDKKIKVPKYNFDDTYAGVVEDYAYKFLTPGVTRVQATKVGAIQTWIQHQADVYWAFRYIDPTPSESQSANKKINNDARTNLTPINSSTLLNSSGLWVRGNDSGWLVLNNTPAQGINATNGNSVNGMEKLAATFTYTDTPLTYAMARSLAQYNNSNNPFNDVMRDEDISQCSNSFVILFTDGADNVGGPTPSGIYPYPATPYLTLASPNTFADTTFNAAMGNKEVINNRYNIESRWFNFYTYAALAAHMSNRTLGEGHYMEALAPSNSIIKQNISDFLPFAIKGRKGVTYPNPKRVTTMAVGVSLGGMLTDTSSIATVHPKRGMFLTAVMGDPDVIGGRLGDFHPFEPPTFNLDGSVDKYNDWELDPVNPGWPEMGKKKEGAVFFFDATDPDKLTESIQAAFRAAIAKGSNNATATPNLPFVGASLAGQVYMGSFAVPEGGGVTWSGDLLMFGTREEEGSVKILDKNGDPTSGLNATSAFWAASDALGKKSWRSRNLYTRLPNTPDPTNPNSPIAPKKFTDDGSEFNNPSTGLKNFISQNQKRAVQFAAGGDTILGTIDSYDRPVTNRKTIMGDIINSAPATVEYEWGCVASKLGDKNNRQFRLILVGTNQGWLHAFGEITTKGNNGKMTSATVEELWAFMPTDFLWNLDYITKAGNTHRFMVDGTPAIYHLDIPSKVDGIGNGIVDVGERAVAIFGLGKGGRSYYAINIEDPFNPKIQWTLVPDEANNKTYFPDSRVESSGLNADNVRNMLGKFGFSSATPAFGRVIFDGATGKQLRDAVFISGGFSVPEVDEKFSAKLGRSIMALDAYTGKVLAAEDLTLPKYGGSVGPIGSGLIPFEFIVNSGAAQRAYFTDYNGGLWAWGSVETATGTPYDKYRVDTSEVKKWELRKVFQDGDASNIRSNRYTTSPAPFLVGNFTGEAKTGTNSIRPAAVGIALMSGDRNNPLDYFYADATKPVNHRLTVVFDRQDNENWTGSGGLGTGPITASALENFTNNTTNSTPTNFCTDLVFSKITPSCPDYYLVNHGNPKFGYYINFPGFTNGFFPKGINSPIVVSGSLFYTVFSPQSADPCTGGVGTSQSWVIADVLNPLKDDKRGVALFASGGLNTWGGAASDYIQLGTRGVLQGGVPAGAAETHTLEINTVAADPYQGFPRPRVWRVVW